MTPAQINRRRLSLLAAPFLLIGSTHEVFSMAAQTLDWRAAYLSGFLFYWIVWCLVLPWWVLGPAGLRSLFALRRLRAGVKPAFFSAALAGPLVLVYAYEFPRAVAGSTLLVIAASLPLSAINGTLEEIFWRGTYLRLFPTSTLWGWLYPSFWFGVWHIVPQQLVTSSHPGGSLAFAGVSVVLGLLWGWIARAGRSIVPGAVAHTLFDFSGLGARVYF